jgi:hypothetical protein
MKLRPGVMPKRPYRDSALLYGAFATLTVVIVGATGGAVLPKIHDHFAIGALPVAAGCFVLATAYSWWRIRQRLVAEEQDS